MEPEFVKEMADKMLAGIKSFVTASIAKSYGRVDAGLTEAHSRMDKLEARMRQLEGRK